MKIQSERQYQRRGQYGLKYFRFLRLKGYTSNGTARFIVHFSNFNLPSELSCSSVDTEEAYRQAETRAKACFAKGYKNGGYVEKPDGTKRYEYFCFVDEPAMAVERMEAALNTSI